MFDVPADTLRKKLADDPSLPQGETAGGRPPALVHPGGDQRAAPPAALPRQVAPAAAPEGPRDAGRGQSNFKGGVGKTVVAQHLANAAALDGYRVLCIDFDPQATLTHSMGLVEVKEWETVWGIMCRDLCREADRITATYDDPDDCPYPSADELPEDVQSIGAQRAQDFIQPTCWPTIDIIPSCANAAFVEFASRPVPRAAQGLDLLRLRRALSRRAAGRPVRPDHLRLPAGHRLPVAERGLRRRHPLYPVRSRLLGIRFHHLAIWGSWATRWPTSPRVRGARRRGRASTLPKTVPRHPPADDPVRGDQPAAPRR